MALHNGPAHGVSARSATALFSAIVGLTTVAILLQGVWAGIFIRSGEANDATWVTVHDWGGRIAIFLALLATVVAAATLRQHRELVVGAAALFVLLFLEAYLGGLIVDSPGVEAVHFPLALALVGLSVWLPLRARSVHRST
jgi:heme A synthase